MRILLVGDDPRDRDARKRTLDAHLPCRVMERAGVEEALELLRTSEEPVDVVLVEHGPPGIDGLELRRRLDGLENPPSVVIITGMGSESLAREALRSGVDDYIVKDADQAYLAELPAVLLRAAERRAERQAGQRTLKQLREAAVRRLALINSLPVGVISLDLDYRITEINSTAERLTRFKAGDSLGEPCEEIVRSDACGEDCPLARAMKSRQPQGPVECKLYNRAGEIVPVNIMAVGIFDDQGRRLGGVEVFQDLRLIKQMEQDRVTMLGVLAHDMKTPLVSIKGFSRLLRDKWQTLSDDKRRQYQDIVYREAEQIEAMVMEFLESSRLRYGDLSLDLAPLKAQEFLEELHRSQEPRFREAGLTLELDARLGGLCLAADAKRLGRALTSLLDNALRYSRPDGVVGLAAELDRDRLAITVTDQGQGIAENDQPHLFEPFYRGGDRKAAPGHGLGLAGVRNIATAHGGEVLVRSRPGEGAAFTIRIPV